MSANVASLQQKLKIIDSSKWFQAIVITVIIVSALLIGAKTHNLPESFVGLMAILDMAITVFFVIELSIRFAACEDKKGFFKNGWNVFDTIIVIGSLIPAGGQGVLLARLLRVFRVLRLISMVPQLRILINALLKAIPQMGYIALLMFVIFYIYAAAGSMYFENINPKLWGDVSISLLTLFRVATFEDWTDYIPLSFLVLFVDNRLFFGLHFLCQQKNSLYKLIAGREVDSESRPSKRDKICWGGDQLKYSC